MNEVMPVTEQEIAQRMLERFFLERDKDQDTIIWRNVSWVPTKSGQKEMRETVYRLTFTKLCEDTPVASPEVPNYED